MNKKFRKEVLKLLPELSVVEDYFYEKPVGHILCGYACELPPSGAYLWTYAFPLYDRFERLHLGFGDRLPYPDGFMDVSLRDDKGHAAEFVRRIEPYRARTKSLAQLDCFASYVESEIGLRNYLLRRPYAATLILLGRAEEAMRELETASALDFVKADLHYNADISKLISDLSADLDVAQETVQGWELETKRRLGLLEA